MKYVLFVSISYKHYKKQNYFRIFLNDTLVDEVTLSKDINPVGIDFVKKNLHTHSWLRRDLIRKYNQSVNNSDFPELPLLPTEKIWLYEVEIPEGSHPDVALEFNIEDSNHTNGFMTKSSMVRVERVGLVSVTEFKKMLQGSYYEVWAYFKNKRHLFIELLGHPLKGTFLWPTVNEFIIQIENKPKEVRLPQGAWIGENFKAKFTTITKHKTLVLQGARGNTRGLLRVDPVFLLLSKHKDVINIYNEDQRSNHT